MTTWSAASASQLAASFPPADRPQLEMVLCQAAPFCPHPAAWRFATVSGAWPIVLCEHHAARWRAMGVTDEAIELGAVVATRLNEVRP